METASDPSKTKASLFVTCLIDQLFPEVGVSVVNALSESLDVEIWRDGQVYRQHYERGEPRSGLEAIGTTKRRGTSMSPMESLSVRVAVSSVIWLVSRSGGAGAQAPC